MSTESSQHQAQPIVCETNSQPPINKWFYEDDAEKLLGVETINYDNGGKSKKGTLGDGRKVLVRKLKGKELPLIQRISNGDESKFRTAVAAMSTKINDSDIVIEDLENLWFNDFMKIISMSSSLNFL